MKKLAAVVATVSIIALAGLSYGADMGGRGMGPGMMGCSDTDGRMMDVEHHISQCLMGLNLDEQQKASIGEIKSRMMKETIRRTAEMRIVQIELKDLLSKDPVDMTGVEAKVKKLEMLRTEMQLSHIRAVEELKTKLTPAQRKKLGEVIEAGPMMHEKGMMHHQE